MKTRQKNEKIATVKSSAPVKKANVVRTPDAGYIPSEREINNGRKVLTILEKMVEVGYTVHREDLFTVTEPELGLEITVDAEQNVICLIANICTRQHLEKNVPNWAQTLLELNNKMLYGAFTLHGDNILLRENLAAENLDDNEMEDALFAMFTGIIRFADVLKLK